MTLIMGHNHSIVARVESPWGAVARGSPWLQDLKAIGDTLSYMIIDVIMSMIMIMIERSRHHKHIKYLILTETETVDGFRRVQGPQIHP